jgi:ribose/xylose/arabinose/galactoside ABC-type transport system permease subunit
LRGYRLELSKNYDWVVKKIKFHFSDPGVWADWASTVALISCVIFFGLFSPVFNTLDNYRSIANVSAPLILVTLGQAFVILCAGIDLAVAAKLQFAAVAAGAAYASGFGIEIAIFLGIISSLVIGYVSGVIIAKVRLSDFIVTLGIAGVAQGIAYLLSNARPVLISEPLMTILAVRNVFGIPLLFWVAIVVAGIAHVTLFHTKFGTYVQATGGNKEAAHDVGINVDEVKIATHAISGLLSGIAGVMITARLGASDPAIGTQTLLSSIASVFLGGVTLTGGRGTIIGPFIGAVVLTAIINGLTLMRVSVFYQPIAVGVIVVIAAILTRFRE